MVAIQHGKPKYLPQNGRIDNKRQKSSSYASLLRDNLSDIHKPNNRSFPDSRRAIDTNIFSDQYGFHGASLLSERKTILEIDAWHSAAHRLPRPCQLGDYDHLQPRRH